MKDKPVLNRGLAKLRSGSINIISIFMDKNAKWISVTYQHSFCFQKLLILFYFFANFCCNFAYELQIAFDFARKQDIVLKYPAYNKSLVLIHQEICWRVESITNFSSSKLSAADWRWPFPESSLIQDSISLTVILSWTQSSEDANEIHCMWPVKNLCPDTEH